MNVQQMLQCIDTKKAEMAKKRPLSPEEIHELQNYHRIGLTYSSNALEGNSLTLCETKILIEDGLTVGGKPILDCTEATGHAKAYDYMLKIATEPLCVTKALICELHRIFYSGIESEWAGVYRNFQVIISGTEYLPPPAEQLQPLIQEFIKELNEKQDTLHPILLAAYAHRRLVDIHPFKDGNGRTARLLMNLILLNKGYQIVSIPPILRNNYLQALHLAQHKKSPNDEKFNELICECEIESQKDFCRLFRVKGEVER